MKLTSIIRWNSAASERPKGADSAAPALAIRMSIGCRAAASAMADLTEACIGDVGHFSEMRRTGCDGFIERCAIAAEHGHDSTGFATAPADIARPMPRPPPVTSAWEERDSWDIGRASRSERSGYILNFKLLQGSGRHSPVRDCAPEDAPSWAQARIHFAATRLERSDLELPGSRCARPE